MQIAKKQLLGFGGLALVVGMTAFAATLPTSAVSVGGEVQVKVQVYAANFETVINSPLDGAILSSPEVQFSETHSHSYGTKYYLEKLNEDGSVAKTYELTQYEVKGDDVNGNTNFTLDLNEYGGAGTYVFRSVIRYLNDQEKEDAVRFTYEATVVDPETVVENEDGTISAEVCYAAGTKSLVYQVKNDKGEVISETYTINTTDPVNGGCMQITINIAKDGVDSGKYTVEINSYDEIDGKGNLISTISFTIDYVAPDAPNVPDTGALLAALNISRTDYLITGIVAFVAISIVSLFLIRRSHNRK